MSKLNNKFIRISGSCIVNLDRIDHVSGREIYMEDGTIIAVGRTYEKDIKTHFPDK